MPSYLSTIAMKWGSQAVVVICCCCTNSLQSLQPSQEAPGVPAPDPVPSHTLPLYNESIMWGWGGTYGLCPQTHAILVKSNLPGKHWVNRCVGICCRLMSLTVCASLFDFYAICCSFVSILRTCTTKPWEKTLKKGRSSKAFVNNSSPLRGPFVSGRFVTLWLTTAAFFKPTRCWIASLPRPSSEEGPTHACRFGFPFPGGGGYL